MCVCVDYRKKINNILPVTFLTKVLRATNRESLVKYMGTFWMFLRSLDANRIKLCKNIVLAPGEQFFTGTSSTNDDSLLTVESYAYTKPCI